VRTELSVAGVDLVVVTGAGAATWQPVLAPAVSSESRTDADAALNELMAENVKG
jgi:hypothetical protein